MCSWLGAARRRLGGFPRLFVCVPFGGFGGPSHAPNGALADGFGRYQSRTPDPKAHLIDLGPEAALHLSECTGASMAEVEKAASIASTSTVRGQRAMTGMALAPHFDSSVETTNVRRWHRDHIGSILMSF